MNCTDFPNNSPRWISCNDASINGTSVCESLNVNLFDIEVLDSQNNPIAEPFEGSAARNNHFKFTTWNIYSK